MTLAESKMTQVMTIKGHFGKVDLTALWFQLCIFSDISLGGSNGKNTIEFKGTMEAGQYVLEKVVGACREAGAHCHLEVNHSYE